MSINEKLFFVSESNVISIINTIYESYKYKVEKSVILDENGVNISGFIDNDPDFTVFESFCGLLHPDLNDSLFLLAIDETVLLTNQEKDIEVNAKTVKEVYDTLVCSEGFELPKKAIKVFDVEEAERINEQIAEIIRNSDIRDSEGNPVGLEVEVLFESDEEDEEEYDEFEQDEEPGPQA